MYFPVKPGTIVTRFSISRHCSAGGFQRTGCTEGDDVVGHS